MLYPDGTVREGFFDNNVYIGKVNPSDHEVPEDLNIKPNIALLPAAPKTTRRRVAKDEPREAPQTAPKVTDKSGFLPKISTTSQTIDKDGDLMSKRGNRASSVLRTPKNY